jgi:3-deoxy-D-manno-octulosonic-acid transferase/heptosyltransferase-1
MKNFMGFIKIRETYREIKLFLKELRVRKYDLVVDFHGLFKSGIMVFLSGGKRRLGYKSFREMSFLFYNETIPEDMEKHAVDRYLDFLRYLGAEVEKPRFIIPINEKDRKYIKELFQVHHIGRDDLVASVNPIALWETKLWAEDKFALLCDRIIDELNAKVIFTGNRKREVIESIISRMKNRVVNVNGKTNLRELACLYQNSDFVITTDSGPMHIAAAVQKPVVALFGPTAHLRTGPYGKGHIVVRKDLPCSPCFKKKCDTMKCMEEITVDDVFEAVKLQVGRCRKESYNLSESRQPS